MTGADTDIVVDGNEHEPTERDGQDRRSTPDDDRAEKPISFDFKLRLGTRESTAALAGRATGELVQLQPIDWDSFTGLRDDDAPREYKTDGDLPSIIVELANQIAGPETLAQAALRMNAAAHGGHSLDDDQDELDDLDESIEIYRLGNVAIGMKIICFENIFLRLGSSKYDNWNSLQSFIGSNLN